MTLMANQLTVFVRPGTSFLHFCEKTIGNRRQTAIGNADSRRFGHCKLG
jgi:hypothetical protein